jgi:hypothetical protein
MRSRPEAPAASQPQHYQRDTQNASGSDDSCGRLKVGDRVQVVNRGDKCDGMVGIVRSYEDDDYKVVVLLEGALSKRVFRSDELKLVTGAAQPPASQRGLSRGAKVGLAVAVGIVLLIIASSVISEEPWHSQRYKDCRAAAQNEGYKGDDLKQVIQFCVDVQ